MSVNVVLVSPGIGAVLKSHCRFNGGVPVTVQLKTTLRHSRLVEGWGGTTTTGGNPSVKMAGLLVRTARSHYQIHGPATFGNGGCSRSDEHDSQAQLVLPSPLPRGDDFPSSTAA